ncbi:putative F-box/FBD/LRR-repeat protein At4g00315 isoform X3 [Capsella rubella]|uniref:putative F-box/FBD/LRR-repeat protein At4g00315 isoform X3 n=1 Tax=Capsella rubella TaxID=81985 RepID=UPI000CD59D42|nr:putative F-box/FBD/LRR-repeat protein At4g00315 isoform X3 [Capsella rubella]
MRETPRFVFEKKVLKPKTRESTMSRKKKCTKCEDKDKISQLPDEVLMKILLRLPTKTAVSTSILSKRWEYLWMWLPKLEYGCSYRYGECERLERFISWSLPLHRAPVIESLRLKLCIRNVEPHAIELWVAFAVSHCIRELSLSFLSCTDDSARMPSSLYICKSLVILKLKREVLIDVPRMACLPSLKTLVLRRVTYSNANSLHKLLSSCPVLTDLVLERGGDDHFGTWKALYCEGIVFNQLTHLELCHCGVYWSKDHIWNQLDPLVFCQDELNCVPKCLLSSLETFKWTAMFATEQERNLMKYILNNACCLKTATIVFEDAPERQVPIEMMIQEFSLSFKGSPTCQLVFEFE